MFKLLADIKESVDAFIETEEESKRMSVWCVSLMAVFGRLAPETQGDQNSEVYAFSSSVCMSISLSFFEQSLFLCSLSRSIYSTLERMSDEMSENERGKRREGGEKESV